MNETLNPEGKAAKFVGRESAEKLKSKGLGLTIVVDEEVPFLFENTLNGFISEARINDIDPCVLRIDTSHKGHIDLIDKDGKREKMVDKLRHEVEGNAILVLTTLVDRSWHSGAMQEALSNVTNAENRIALVSLIAQTQGSGTALDYSDFGTISLVEQEGARTLRYTSRGNPFRRREKEGEQLLRLPIISLEKEYFSNYINLLSGEQDITVGAVSFNVDAIKERYEHFRQERGMQRELSAEERIRNFVASVSPRVYKLAALLSVTPLQPAIVKEIMHSMLPDTTEKDFAHLYFSGLLRKIDDDQLDFQPGIRDELMFVISEGMQALSIAKEVIKAKFPEKGAIYEALLWREVPDSLVLDQDTIEFAECIYRFSRRMPRGFFGEGKEEKLEEAITKYRKKDASSEREPIGELEENNLTALRRIAAIDPKEFKEYQDLKKIAGFPEAFRTSLVAISNGDNPTIQVEQSSVRGLFDPRDYPTINLSWQHDDSSFTAQLVYLEEEERKSGDYPARISLQSENEDGYKTSFHFGYKRFPGQTLEPGSFDGFLEKDGKLLEGFSVTSHWGHTTFSGGKGKKDSSPEELSQQIASGFKWAAGAVLEKMELKEIEYSPKAIE